MQLSMVLLVFCKFGLIFLGNINFRRVGLSIA